jgi:hypothetical protein
LHPKDAVAKNDRPAKAFQGDVQDVIYLTTMLNKPGELQVTSGGVKTALPVKPGIRHVRVPFHCGSQHFAVFRDGQVILSQAGKPVLTEIERYDFFPSSGFVISNQ